MEKYNQPIHILTETEAHKWVIIIIIIIIIKLVICNDLHRLQHHHTYEF